MRKTNQAALFLVATYISGSACIVESPDDEVNEVIITQSSSGLVRHEMNPSATDFGEQCQNNAVDSAIGCDQDNQWGLWANNEPHVLFPGLFMPPIESRLLVFLPGRNGEAANPDLDRMYEMAALMGYHVIGLQYPNGGVDHERHPGNLSHYCAGDGVCMGKFMQEIIDGTQCPTEMCADEDGHDDLRYASASSGHPQDTIVNRLEMLLWTASVTFPFEGWSQYVNSSGVRWDRVTIAGHSLGSSYAAMVGRQFPVRRAATFSGPDDSINGQPAAWIQPLPVSKRDKFFGLIHEDDDLTEAYMAWSTMGLQGLRYFDPAPGTTPSFGSAHMLVSTDGPTTKPHNSVVTGEYDSGAAIGYEQTWAYMFGSGFGF